MIAGLLVVGEMLDRTGVARMVGDAILRRGGGNQVMLLIMIMVAAALLGGFMSSTAIVAIFIPVVLRIAKETKSSASRLLMPMSYAALISGMITLVGTPPNLVVHEELQLIGASGFGLFSFTPIGLAVLAVAIAYTLLTRRWLLPDRTEVESEAARARSVVDLGRDYHVTATRDALRVTAASPLVGRTIGEAEIEERFGFRVLGIRRGERRSAAPQTDTTLRAGDVLLVFGAREAYDPLVAEAGLVRTAIDDRDLQRWLWEAGGAAVLIHPESRLIGKSIRQCEFRTTYGLHVLGLRRGGKPLECFEDEKLQASDDIFVVGKWSCIDALQARGHDFVVTELPRERGEVVQKYRKAPIAIVILLAMVALILLKVVPLVAAVLLAALAAIVTRCLTMEDAYRAIHWSSIVLVAGMLPLADALAGTGGTDAIVSAMLAVVGEAGPRVVLTVVFFLTAIMSLFLSNTASAVLVAPIAMYAAQELNVSPYPLAVAVVMGASAAYATPISSPVVTLVVDPGRYTFLDFVKVGTPLMLLTYLVTLVLTPLLFPFDGFVWP
jgi:di/tricarboxylate transporter